MRVIAGKYKGKILNTPKDNDIRPTTDRIKEDIFNILMPYIPDCLFWDMFSGTGGMGIEAVSRGANKAVLTDNSFKSIDLIKSNIKKVGVSENEVSVIKSSAEKYLFKNKEKFDIIFADPPYNYENIFKLIELVAESEVLLEHGVFVLEHDKKIAFPDKIGLLNKIKTKKYSLTQIDFFKV